MNKKPFIIITIILLGLSFTLYNLFFSTKKKERLIFGVMNGWPPYMNINQKGELEGFDIDIIKEIEAQSEKKIIIQDMGSLTALFVALEKGRVDAIFSGLDITEKRKSAYDYILYGTPKSKITQYCFISLQNKPITEKDLKTKKCIVGIESGVSWEKTLDEFNLIEKIHLNSISDMVLCLEQNKIDCFVIDPIQAQRLIKKIPELSYFTLNIDPSCQIDGIGIFIQKNNQRIKSFLEKYIEKLYEMNYIQITAQKWNL